ncbi:MAG: hypothetical protein K2V38_10595 [Gemmataceae bacterium]|nr:hypothetical protein [Gemmataceae bacterium]
MELPKNFEQYVIWVGMQFPVLGAAAVVARWVMNRERASCEGQIKANDDKNAALVKVKDEQIAERDARIAELKADHATRQSELKAEIAELKAKLSRTKASRKDDDGGAT